MCDNADSEILKNDVTIIYNNLVIKNNFGGCKVKNKFCFIILQQDTSVQEKLKNCDLNFCKISVHPDHNMSFNNS